MSTGDCGNGGGGGCECGCCCVHNKMEDIKPHPVMEQLPGVQYCINSPPPLRSGSYSSGVPALSNDSRYHCLDSKLRRLRFLTPLSMVPLMTFTGLGLYYLGFSMYLPHYAKAKIKRRVCDRYALLFSVAFVWGYAQILTSSGAYRNASSATQASCRTDRAGLITGAPWLYIPYPFQWGRPTFQAGEAFAMMAASFVASLESTGTFLATARYGSATPVPASVVNRGVGWLGFGTLLSGLFGTVTGCTASVENAGLLAMTRVGSRRVVQVSAGFMIFFSLLGKFGAFFASIPLPIIAALYCFFFGYVSSAGLGLLQYCNLNSFRTKFILGFSFFLGLSVPQYFREYQLSSGASPVHTHSRWFNDMVTVVFTSHATVAVLVAVILDCTLVREDDEGGNDSGSHWWEKFVFYNRDVRSHDFYKLPCKLNKLFPPV
ncbi:hypothetical protein RHGRI_016424 [Rhododendron griersonianum]|uniref:Nucleobase-ascorbate transporter 10 n=1 Tax=Rhododendron griersonianum TaxID=479676 RepID=A0AAV6JU35_9ERIC|nr:hypothetical protein RHGRI_016424 [Rhododendron griersonianum]